MYKYICSKVCESIEKTCFVRNIVAYKVIILECIEATAVKGRVQSCCVTCLSLGQYRGSLVPSASHECCRKALVRRLPTRCSSSVPLHRVHLNRLPSHNKRSCLNLSTRRDNWQYVFLILLYLSATTRAVLQMSIRHLSTEWHGKAHQSLPVGIFGMGDFRYPI